jgi:integrase
LIALEKSAVDFGRNRLFVANPKWKRDRRKTEGVPMSREAAELVQRLCDTAHGSYLFTDEQGQGLKRGTVSHFFSQACARARVLQAFVFMTCATNTARAWATPTLT